MAPEHHDNANDTTLVEQVTEYVQLQLTATKLATVEFLALMLSNGFGILLAVVAGLLALMFIFGAVTLWIAEAIGSLEWAMIIVAIFFAIVGIMAYVLREEMIANRLVRGLSRMFFETDNNHKTDVKDD